MLRRAFWSLVVLAAVYAAVTVAQAAYDTFWCRDGAQAQSVQTEMRVYCRDFQFLGIDTSQHIATVALGPPATQDSANTYRVLHYPYGLLCSMPPIPDQKGP